MEPFIRNFIRSSLVWLGVGVLIGLSMAFFPAQALVYKPAHVHANLLGFVSMMIFGVAYHVVPRFTGNPLHSRTLARTHLWLANLGLSLLVGGWILRVRVWKTGGTLVEAGAALSAVAMSFFIYNLWRTLGTSPAARNAPQPLSGAAR
ncbi:MAG TPA: cbb3-type cytochrome c oxidase subunit I [Longimicrobiaceae bacterium]|nr:cbb3-type cytochrome c oxidase subunit I [Longimicrobiaceae bacterium]